MNSKKLRVNLLFALVVAALGLTAVTFLLRNRNQTPIRPPAAEGASGSSLPENHPPLDSARNLSALEQLSAKDPANADYLTQIANIYYDLGQYEKAADAYQRSLKVRPGDASVETDLASCFHYLGQHDKALETLNNVLTYRPSFAQALFNKGIVLISGKKDIRGGIAVWEELLRLDPDFSRKADLEQRINSLKASAK
jgi:tetratricopeptide (TPR) repeat protein